MAEQQEQDRVNWFVHAVQHTWARTGHHAAHVPEKDMVYECWGTPLTDPPPWAIDAAKTGKPAATWCPVLNPRLTGEEP